MKKVRILALAVLLLGAALLPSCGSGGSSVSGQGHLDVYLTDAPACLPDVQSVVVSITGAWIFPGVDDTDGDMDPNNDAGSEGPPIPIMDYPAEFDLLSLMNGVTTILGSTDLPAGWYHKIRMEVSKAVLTFTDGSTADLKIDSHKVDVLARIQVNEDGTTAVTLDFDACQSVKITTTGDSDMYILRPVVNALHTP
jgi:hypothetical protein